MHSISKHCRKCKEQTKIWPDLEARNVDILKDYQANHLTVVAVAAKYQASPGLVALIAKNAGLKLRGRGKKRQSEPNARVRRILRTAQKQSLVITAQENEVSKQYVFCVTRQWMSWIDRSM